VFPCWLIRFSGISGGREGFLAVIKPMVSKNPKGVHEVKVGAWRRKGIQGAANEGSKEAVIGELCYPVGEERRC